METILDILKIVLPTILSFVIGWLTSKLRKAKQQKEDSEAFQQALVWVLRWVAKKAILEDAKWYLENGITAKELKEFTDAYNSYHTLGGNGEVTVVYKKVCALEVKVE